MSPNCQACDAGDHAECHQRGQTTTVVCNCECPTATDARRMLRVPDQQTDQTIPVYAVLDLWMALGYDAGHEFDDQVAIRGVVDLWAFLCMEVRKLNARGYEKVSAQVTENGDPLYQMAKRHLETFRTYDEVDHRIDYSEIAVNARGERMHGTLRAVLTIEGTL